MKGLFLSQSTIGEHLDFIRESKTLGRIEAIENLKFMKWREFGGGLS